MSTELEEVPWQEAFRDYAALHAQLFPPDDPASPYLYALVHGGEYLPQDADVACALALIDGEDERAVALLPVDDGPGTKHVVAVLLRIAARWGAVAAVGRLLQHRQTHVTPHVLVEAAQADRVDVVRALLATDELDDLDVQACMVDTLSDEVNGLMFTHLTSRSGGCVVL